MRSYARAGQLEVSSSTASPSIRGRRYSTAARRSNLIDTPRVPERVPGPLLYFGLPLRLDAIRPRRGTWLYRCHGAGLLGSLSLRLRCRIRLAARPVGHGQGSWRFSPL